MLLPPSLSYAFWVRRLSTPSSHFSVPSIRVIADESVASRTISQGDAIRRWKGTVGMLGDRTLQLPDQGLTSGARLALARQGRASGSFKMNCAESIFVVDERGLAMYQRVDIEQQLLADSLGPRERLPNNSSCTPATLFSGPPSKPGLRSQARNRMSLPARRSTQNFSNIQRSMSYNADGMSSCATFTSGLFSLEDYLSSNTHYLDSNEGEDASAFSVDCAPNTENKSFSGICDSNTWFYSLRRRERRPDLSTKPSQSPRALIRSLSIWKLSKESPPPLSSKVNSERVSRCDASIGTTLCVADLPECLSSSSRTGSWSRVRRSLTLRGHVKDTNGTFPWRGKASSRRDVSTLPRALPSSFFTELPP